MQYRFNHGKESEAIAIAAEAALCKLAAERGMPFSGVTQRWAIPQPERLPLPEGAGFDEVGEPTGAWLFPRIPDDVLAKIPWQTALKWLNEYQPEIID